MRAQLSYDNNHNKFRVEILHINKTKENIQKTNLELNVTSMDFKLYNTENGF